LHHCTFFSHSACKLCRPLQSLQIIRPTVTRLSAILNDADFVHDVSTVHRCPKAWTLDEIVASRDGVMFCVHGLYPVSRCPRGQGVRAVSSLLGFERKFSCVRRKWGGRNLQQFATPPLDQERGDFPSRADGLARRHEIHGRKCKMGLKKRREIFLGYLHISVTNFSS